MKTTYPLSKSQYGIYVECMNNSGQVCYNIGFHYQLDGSLDGQRLCKAIETAFKAHPTYFTRIGLNEENEPVQSIDMSQEDWSLTINKPRISKKKELLSSSLIIYTKTVCSEHVSFRIQPISTFLSTSTISSATEQLSNFCFKK